MSDPKKKNPVQEEGDWASALDEWEQKAFSSVHPEPVSDAPQKVTVAKPAPLPVVVDDAPTEIHDATLASPAAKTSYSSRPPPEDAVTEIVTGEDDGDVIVVDRAPSNRPRTVPPPLPVTPPARAPEAREHSESLSRALRAATSSSLREEPALSRMPMPSMRQVSDDLGPILDEQAQWLEAEAKERPPLEQARTLLAVSEIRALLGERERAHALATQAKDLAPEQELAHVQARGLAAGPVAWNEEAEALLREESIAEGPARAHAGLLAAEALRLAGDVERAAEKLGAMQSDVRAVVSLAALRLASGDLDELSNLLASLPSSPVAAGIDAALRLRGVDTPAGAPEPGSPHAVNDAWRRARAALDARDLLSAARHITAVRSAPELDAGAAWLAAAFGAMREKGRAEATQSLEHLARSGDQAASRVLAARAVENDDADAARAAIALGSFSLADRLALGALLEVDVGGAGVADDEELGGLLSAVSAMDAGSGEEGREARDAARAERVVGSRASRAQVTMGRLLASGATADRLDAARRSLDVAEQRAVVELELALRAGAHATISDLLRIWGGGGAKQGRPTDTAIAGAIIAEAGGERARALSAYREARELDPKAELPLRAAADLFDAPDFAGELNTLADELGASVQGSLARLEAVLREDSVDDATRLDLLERAHQSAPEVPVSAVLAERIAVRNGDAEGMLRWIEARKALATDPTLLAIDALREAKLLSADEPDKTAERIRDAHLSRPTDLALRELYERVFTETPHARAAFWEAQALASQGASRTRMLLDAAHLYERAALPGDALRAATSAGEAGLARFAQERAALLAGEPSALVDTLLAEAKATSDPVARREAYERLADIDGAGRRESGSALLWHQSILEESPAHLPSLRFVEHALITAGREDELEPIVASVAYALRGEGSDETVAHADLAARLRARGANGDWESTYDVAEIAAGSKVPSLVSLRLMQAHARFRKNDELFVAMTEKLIERASRPIELAALRLRLAEAAFRQNDLAASLTSLEQSTGEDPGDLAAYRLLAEVRRDSGDVSGAAEAHESIARLSLVPEHRLEAWYAAARLWAEEGDVEHAVHDFEQAAEIDLRYQDTFTRLSALYLTQGAHGDLAALLERRVSLAEDAEERVTLEVERGRALLLAGDRAGARDAVVAALADRPEHTTALSTFAELSAIDEDWAAAEDAWVRLARLLPDPAEQRAVYERLGDLYAHKAVHLERAEVALNEVLKRSADDPDKTIATLEKLVDVYKRRLDTSRAVETQQELIAKARSPKEKKTRLVELALIHEDPGHEERKAEQVLEGARREFPTDVGVLKALAEFYARHRQTPAVNILLDRASADARRAFAAGRFAPELFELMQGLHELRGKHEAARIVGASLQAIAGKPTDVRGGYGPALDPSVDDLLAPEIVSSGLRTLLLRTGSALDAASPVDLRTLAAAPAGPEARIVTDLAAAFASGLRMETPQIYVAKAVGRNCLAAASDPPALVVGEALLSGVGERVVAFLVMRAMKLVSSRAAALVRTQSTELAVLVAAWLQGIAPSWTPQGINPSALAAASRRVAPGLPGSISEETRAVALEVASQLGTRASTLGTLALAWADRAALLGIGDPSAALEAIAWSLGSKEGAPTEVAARAAWISRTHEAKDLLIFSIGDAYAEARARLDLTT